MFDSKLLEKAKAAKSVAELLDIAKENNIELSEEQAKTYFAQLSPKNGELSDEELDNVSGGMRPLVAGTVKPNFFCLLCPNCQNGDTYHGSDEQCECKKCGCRWNSKTGEILN